MEKETKRIKKQGESPKDEAKEEKKQSGGDGDDILDTELMLETSSVAKTKGRYPIHCLTIVGQVEGHTSLPSDTKST
ncbi:MAG: peptidase S14, partial [Oscillospiraceae bacterium]